MRHEADSNISDTSDGGFVLRGVEFVPHSVDNCSTGVACMCERPVVIGRCVVQMCYRKWAQALGDSFGISSLISTDFVFVVFIVIESVESGFVATSSIVLCENELSLKQA